ncbi:DeoR family transcriptional regulator [Motilibacter rhizosphaerae]|uniref:DeoR family transcriptional regulator n=1 Tax=Motilibacter rhizosphaerae TaxID=598652 RepID=A0A4V2F526_9ACTN|nr:DeoR/GlpR family DNA-binding transcription regulator [Motilibacter rhizosphaerae]RZS91349.1 DeoR family transcriptional regulator [Motilibacter rhizosphaerae]
MFAAERRRLISELVATSGAVSLRELARLTGTSEVTVRRDLRSLEAEGLLSRRHGGAVAREALHEPTHSEKSHVAAAEKAAIAAAAAELVEDGEALVLGPGTTTQALARRLTRKRDLTVVTNSLLVAQALSRAPGVDVVMTGGSLRGSIFALVGGDAEHALAGLRVSTAFMSGNGLSAERGLSTPSMLVAGVDRAIAAAARRVVVLVDHTKVGVDTMVQTVPTSRIDLVVTDAAAPPDAVAALRAADVECRVVDVDPTAG